MSLSLSARGALVATLMLGHAWAGAATYTLAFDGDVANLVTNSFDSGIRHFDTGVLALTTLDLPIAVNQGDEIDAVITLSNGPFMLPASPEQFFGLNLLNATNAPPAFDQGSHVLVLNGSYDFQLGGQSVWVPNNANCGNCVNLITGDFPGSAHAFDSIVVHMTFGNLTAPYTIDSASISYQLSAPLPVPEPAQWALMAGGLLGVAALARRRQAPAA